MAKLEIHSAFLIEAEYPAWNQLVASAPTGSIYSRPEYLDALCTAAGGRFRILATRQGDVLLGGVALYENDASFGSYVSPRRLLYYNGPVLRQHDVKYPSEQTARHLRTLISLEAALSEAGYGGVVLRPRSPLADVRPFLARGWTANIGYSYVVSITDLEQTRSRIEQNLRRLIDRCARNDVEFAEDDDFESFYQLHTLTMQRVDFQVYLPEAAFRNFYAVLARQGLAKLFHGRYSGAPAIASQLVLLGHPVTHTVAAGADPEHMKSGVTAFLRWKSFERLRELGHTANDLTDASLNAATHFKSQLGGSLEQWTELRSPESSRFKWGTRLSRLASLSRGAAGAVARKALRKSPDKPNDESND